MQMCVSLATMYICIYIATPAEVIDHYFCFLADSFNNDTFCQIPIMSSLKLLKEDNQATLTVVASEYQRNSLLLNHLLASDAASISRFCHILQDTATQADIGHMLVNGMFVYCDNSFHNTHCMPYPKSLQHYTLPKWYDDYIAILKMYCS